MTDGGWFRFHSRSAGRKNECLLFCISSGYMLPFAYAILFGSFDEMWIVRKTTAVLAKCLLITQQKLKHTLRRPESKRKIASVCIKSENMQQRVDKHVVLCCHGTSTTNIHTHASKIVWSLSKYSQTFLWQMTKTTKMSQNIWTSAAKGQVCLFVMKKGEEGKKLKK